MPESSQNTCRWAAFSGWLLVSLFFLWSTCSDGTDWNYGKEQNDYYNRLVDGLLQGELSLATPVSPALLVCDDPYDPARRPQGAGLHDASYYKGRYYIYYGVVPAVVLMLPFRILTGIDLPIAVAVFFFVWIGYGISLLLLMELRRRYFPACGPGLSLLLALALGLASCLPLLLRRHSMYELPIAGGYCFAGLALYALHRAFVADNRPLTWLAFSSLSWGLAIGSRPILILAPLALLPAAVILLKLTPDMPLSLRRATPILSAAVLPIAIVGIGLALYNYLRFGSPFEFGLNYILSSVYESKIEHFRPRYYPWNVTAYFLAPVEWSTYFPFLRSTPLTLERPFQHFGMDFPFGLLLHVPIIALAPVGLFAALNASREFENRSLRWTTLAIGWTGLTMTAFLLGFYAAMLRYLGDLAPWLVLLACLSYLFLLERLRQMPLRSVLAPILASIVCISSVLPSLFSLHYFGSLEFGEPRTWSALARIANAPGNALRTLLGMQQGALLMKVRTPPAPKAGTEVCLLQFGRSASAERLLLRFLTGEKGQLVYRGNSSIDLVSNAIAISSHGEEAALRVCAGPLLSIDGNQAFDALDSRERRSIERRLLVQWNDRTIVDRHLRFGDFAPDAWRPGPSTRHGGVRLSEVTREPLSQTLASLLASLPPPQQLDPVTQNGWLHLRVRFGEAAPGFREPLIVTGRRGRADFIIVEHLGGRRIRFIHDHWGKAPRYSEPTACDMAREHRISIQCSAFMNARNLSGAVVLLNGTTVAKFSDDFYRAAPDEIELGRNLLGGSLCSQEFSGTITPVEAQSSFAAETDR